MIDKNHVKGVVCDVNKHRAAAMTDDGYTIFDIEAPDYAKTSWVIRGISRE